MSAKIKDALKYTQKNITDYFGTKPEVTTESTKENDKTKSDSTSPKSNKKNLIKKRKLDPERAIK